MADEIPAKQKQREPITMFFGIILLAACLLAIGIFISDHVLGDDEDKVTNTSKVTVDYTGAIYGYYDEGGAIFQTTIDSIDDNEKYRYTPTYTFNNSTITVDMANPTVLAMFASALEGHSVGDTVRVAIPASEAYDKPVVYEPIDLSGIQAPNTNNVLKSSLDGLDKYGWTYNYVFDDNTGMYIINYTMGNDMVIEKDVDGVTYRTSNFDINSDSVTYDLAVSNVVKAKDESGNEYTIDYENKSYTAIESFYLPGTDFIVVGAENVEGGSISGDILVKAASGFIDNMPLFFVIKIVSME